MKKLCFTEHALERAVQRFFPGQTQDAAQAAMMEAWNNSPSKLRGGRYEERWLLGELDLILVCAIEDNEIVVKTVLRKGGQSDEDPDTIPSPGHWGKVVLRLEVEYMICDDLLSHTEVQKNMEVIATKSFSGSMNSKKVSVLNIRSSSESAIGPNAPKEDLG